MALTKKQMIAGAVAVAVVAVGAFGFATLNSGGGGISRPLVEVDPTMGIADIALTELIHEKIGFQIEEETPASEDKAPEASRRKRRVRSLTS